MMGKVMYSEQLYYAEKRSETNYGYTPTSNPNVGKLIKGEPYWRRNQLISALKKKTLIFADWTISGWSESKMNAVKEKMRELLRDGFEIYLRQDDTLSPLDEKGISTLSQESIQRKINLEFKDKIISQAIKQLQLINDQVCVLDDYQVDCLLDEDNAHRPRQFRLNSEFYTLILGKDKIVSILQNAIPPISTFVQEEFSQFCAASLVKEKNNYPGIGVEYRYRKLNLFSSQITTLIKTYDEINLGEEKIASKDLYNVEKLQILQDDEALNVSDLEILFSQIPNIQNLHLDCFSNLAAKQFQDLNLRELTNLSLFFSTISSNNLMKLISDVPNLKNLQLRQLRGGSNIPISNITFPLIENLIIKQCDVSFLNLDSLLTNAKSLMKLDLTEIEVSNLNIESPLDFPLLKEIYLSENNLSKNNLSNFNVRKIISAASNIKVLQLGKYKGVFKDLFKDNSFPIKLDQLETLSISDNDLSVEDLQNLLEHTPNLKQLTLSNCPNLKEGFLSAKLPKLRYLRLNECHFSSKNFHHLLSNAPDLKDLTLTNCPDILQSFKQTNLRALKNLELSECNVSPVDFQQLLYSAPGVNSLGMGKERADVFDELIQSNFLASLKDVEISRWEISADQLKQFLYKTTNLQMAMLPGGIHRDDELNSLIKKISRVIGSNHGTGIAADNSQFNQSVKTERVDADTRLNSEQEYNFSRIFYPVNSSIPLPAVSLDRLNIFDSLKVTETSCQLENAFLLEKETSLGLISRPIEASPISLFEMAKKQEEKLEASETLYYGQQKFRLNQEWQPIPSLSVNEVMTHYHIEPADDTVEIQYSTSHNQYYIRSKNQGKEISLDFLLKVPVKSNPLPEDIRALVDYFDKEFRAGPLEYDKPLPTGHDYLRYIQEQRKGACRHRAVAFKALVKEKYPDTPVRIVTNQCHAFAEVKINDQWLTCNLGGYPATLNINESNNPHNKNSETLISRIVANPISEQEKNFTSLLETWRKDRKNIDSLELYCQQLVRIDSDKKRLVEVESDKALESLHLNLQSHCKHISRPVYYINSPEDLICSAPFVKRDGDRGVLQRGPGGPLYDFLTQSYDKSNPPVLLVNYSRFNADDIVNFNGLLDEIRHADGTLLPQDTLVIGLINPNNPNSYQGEDFYSRFDTVETCPLKQQVLEDALPVFPFIEEGRNFNTFLIDLCNSPDWEERLLGRWVIDTNNLYFQEGELKAALTSNLPIEIRNGPWEDKKFINLWQQLQVHKCITYGGQKIDFPEGIQFLETKGYPRNIPRMKATFTPNAPFLNPTKLSEYFYQYQYNKDLKILEKKPGIIEKNAKKQIDINLTRTLTDDESALLFQECNKHQVKMVWRINLPTAELDNFNKTSMKDTQVIISSDVDTTLAQITQDNLDWQVIDVSECEAADLLVSIKGYLNKETLRFEFSETEQALLNALKANKKVILKGSFSNELVDLLAPLIIERQNNSNVKGQLIIIGENQEQFDFWYETKHSVSIADKKEQLGIEFSSSLVDSLSESLLEKESLSKLRTRLAFQKRHSDLPTDDAWKGMLGLPVAIKLSDFDVAHSIEKAAAFVKERLSAVNAILKESPYVFLTGLTAVGKSTFVEKNLNDKQNTLYQGESRLVDWAIDRTEARKILFIDEANIGKRQWSEFEGLFNRPPGILIDGKYYPLTDKHKVVFAGNPLSYGGERQLAPFFARHGNAVLFEPMPQEFIYEAILKPVFVKTELESHSLNIALPLLAVYRFICESSHTEVRISARELQMMALLVLSYSKQNPKADFSAIAEHYAYQLGKNLVPEERLSAFNKQFAPQRPLLIPDEPSTTKTDFLLTPSRRAIRQELDDLLTLRQVRREANNPAQQYGGLGGIVLEGEPGIGKSEMVMSTLIEHGYQEAVLKSSLIPAKAFYRMPVSMQIEEKKNLLLKAFDEGAVVVIDEINSSPMMERLLNDLLMGKTPEGQRPAKPGFLVIGTQNPVTMAGRRPPGNALARRLIKTVLPPYEAQEMQAILISKGADYIAAVEMVAAYTKNLTVAKEKNHTPAPTFRDLLRLAKRYVLAHQKNALKPEDNLSVLRDADLKNEKSADEVIALNNPFDSIKTRLNVTKISADERADNIYTVQNLLNNTLFNEEDGTTPDIIQQLRNITAGINPKNDEEISEAIIKIKNIILSRTTQENPNVEFLLKAFSNPEIRTFRQIREFLSKDVIMGSIMDASGKSLLQ